MSHNIIAYSKKLINVLLEIGFEYVDVRIFILSHIAVLFSM